MSKKRENFKGLIYFIKSILWVFNHQGGSENEKHKLYR